MQGSFLPNSHTDVPAEFSVTGISEDQVDVLAQQCLHSDKKACPPETLSESLSLSVSHSLPRSFVLQD